MKETMEKRDELDEKVDELKQKYFSLVSQMKKGFEDKSNWYVFTLASKPLFHLYRWLHYPTTNQFILLFLISTFDVWHDQVAELDKKWKSGNFLQQLTDCTADFDMIKYDFY